MQPTVCEGAVLVPGTERTNHELGQGFALALGRRSALGCKYLADPKWPPTCVITNGSQLMGFRMLHTLLYFGASWNPFVRTR